MNNLQIAGDLDVADGGEGGEVTIGAECSFGEDRMLQNRISEKHVTELSPDLARDHFDSPRARHTYHGGRRPAEQHIGGGEGR